MTNQPLHPANDRAINWIGAITAVVALLCGALWYIARLDARVAAIESASAHEKASVDQVNCATIASRVADAYRAGNAANVAQPLERLMDRIGCDLSAEN